jgi:hypothetical protein
VVFEALVVVCLSGLAGSSGDSSRQYFPEPKSGSRSLYDVQFWVLGQLEKATMIISSDGYEIIGGQRYHREIMAFSGLPGARQETLHERWTPKGVYAVDAQNKAVGEYLDTPFPISGGSKWSANTPREIDEY